MANKQIGQTNVIQTHTKINKNVLNPIIIRA